MEFLFVFIGRENCAIMKLVGNYPTAGCAAELSKNYPTWGMASYPSADVDERNVFKWVLV